MNNIILSTLHTLKKAQNLLNGLTDSQLSDKSIEPYNSSIGSHLRHILDFYDCIFRLENNVVDLTDRNRNRDVESKCCYAENYLDDIMERLTVFNRDINESITVIDDLGLGKIEMTYTLGAVLAQANSHTIHHYAIMNYILKGLGVEINEINFGYNPTTPTKVILK